MSNGFELYEASVFTDILGSFGEPQIEVVSTGIRSVIKPAFGPRVLPDAMLAELNLAEFAALVIPGGVRCFGYYEDAYGMEFQRVIRHFDEADRPIASICAGALPIARSGILRGRRATTYHLSERMKAELASHGVNVTDKHMVVDGKIITSSSPATAVEVALTLLEMLTSAENRQKVARALGFEDV